jgi:hypothetical protein
MNLGMDRIIGHPGLGARGRAVAAYLASAVGPGQMGN